MKNKEIFLKYILPILDMLVVCLSFIAAYWLRFHIELFAKHVSIAPITEYLKALPIIVLIWLPIFKSNNLYELEIGNIFVDEFKKVFTAVSYGTLAIVSITFFYREFSYSRLVCLYTLALSIIGLLLIRVLFEEIFVFMLKKILGVKKILVILSKDASIFIKDRIEYLKKTGCVILFADTLINNEARGTRCEVRGTIADYINAISRMDIDEVLIADTSVDYIALLELTELCEKKNINLKIFSNFYDLIIDKDRIENLDGIPIYRVREKTINFFNLVVKRIMDIIISLILLIITLPLWIAIIITLKFDTETKTIFFSQKRVGKDGRIFNIYKFRTMVEDAETKLWELISFNELKDPVFKIRDDIRTTKIGKILRRTSLDEIPQLINVLKGEMSLVGPRPEEEWIVNLYNTWQRRRLKIKPGITGLQQIYSRGSTNLTERIKWDIYYIKKQSLFLDIEIIIKTIFAVISCRGAI